MDTLQCTTPYEAITNRILALLEQGTVPWRQPVRRDS
jgi:antirestriction protein ArdC